MQKEENNIEFLEKFGKSNNVVQIGYDKYNFKLYALKILKLLKNKQSEEQFVKASIEEIIKMTEVSEIKSKYFVKMHKYFLQKEENKSKQFNFVLVMDLGDGSLYEYQKFVIENCQKYDLSQKKLIFLNIFKIVRDVFNGLEEMHKFNCIHSDIKGANLLTMRNYEGKAWIKFCDFGSMISWEEFLENDKKLKSTTYAKKLKANNKDEFFKIDIYCVGKTLENLLRDKKIQNLFDSTTQIIFLSFKTDFIDKLIYDDLNEIYDLKTCQQEFRTFLNKNNIQLQENDNLFIDYDFIKFMTFDKIENREYLDNYLQKGFYDKPIRFLVSELEKFENEVEANLKLGYIYDTLLRNRELGKHYYQKYKMSVSHLNTPEVEKHLLSIDIHEAKESLECDPKKATEMKDKILPRINWKSIDIRDPDNQEIINNMLYLLIETSDYVPTREIFNILKTRLEEEKIEPSYGKNFEGKKEQKMTNYFFFVFYNLNSVFINYSKKLYPITPELAKESLHLMEQSIEIAKTIYAPKTSNLAQLLNNYGLALNANNQFEEAYQTLEKSYKIRLELKENSSDYRQFSESYVLIPYYNMGKVY